MPGVSPYARAKDCPDLASKLLVLRSVMIAKKTASKRAKTQSPKAYPTDGRTPADRDGNEEQARSPSPGARRPAPTAQQPATRERAATGGRRAIPSSR